MATEQSVLAIIRASRPNFKNPCDKIAFAIHSIFLASGFNLHATGPPAFTDHALSAPFPDEASIDGWNEVEDNYAIDDFVGESGDTKYSSQFKNLGKLVDCVSKDVVTKLTGSSNTSTSSSTTSSEPKVQDNDNQPRSGSFGLEDTRAPYHPSGVVMPPVYPSIGSDVFPQPPAGTYPTRDGFGDGGMLVGPKDPRFLGGGVGGPMGFPGGQPGVPPGARFDPFGPPNVPGFEPDRFTRNPRRPPGGTHPDLEHFGSGSDFI